MNRDESGSEFSWPVEGHLTVVVPIHGQREMTQQFLMTWERQSRYCPLVFVDDCSPDDSVQWLRAAGYPVLVPEQRLWFNGIVNLALCQCRTPLVGILNNDLLLGRRFVELTVEAFERSGFDFLVPRTLETTCQDVLDRVPRYKVVRVNEHEGWCMLLRTAAARALPPIPDDLRLLAGDTWLFHHAWQQHLKVGIMPHNRIHHFRGVTRSASPDCSNPVCVADNHLKATKYTWLSGKQRGLYRLIPGRALRRLLLPYYRPSQRKGR